MDVRSILAAKGGALVTTHPERTLEEAASLLSARRIGAVLVMDGERLAGILSERDIVRAIASLGADALRDRVATHMTEDVVTCAKDARVSDLMELMTSGKFRHLPVLDGGRVTGVISIGDVVKHRLTEMEQETRALEHYISS